MIEFKTLNLIEPILTAIEKKGYVNPTPIQEKAIPHLLEGKDLLGIAQTGTGKTAAFSLPILNRLVANPIEVKSKSMRALILTPTRELASQIADNIASYSKGLHIKHTVIFGGVSENPQIAVMKKGVDIVIATPGRLLDLYEQGYINFSQVEVFVLDEADRMLDMGFIIDIRKIISKLPHNRQNLLFSATMPKDIAHLAHSILKDPVRVEVTPESTTVEKIEQSVCFVEKSNKAPLLKYILDKEKPVSVLVFCKTKHGANKLATYLEKENVRAAAIHGNKTQAAREKALQKFRNNQVQVLVATDIAARGIDIPSVSHVINYDIPHEAENYVHRIGRTARAGREGIAIAFCDSLERPLLKTIEKVIKRSILVDETHPYHGKAGISEFRKIASGKKISNEQKQEAVAYTKPNVAGRMISKGGNLSKNNSDFAKKNYEERDLKAHAKPRHDRNDRRDRDERNANQNRDERHRNSKNRFEKRSGFDEKRDENFGADRRGGNESKPFKKKKFKNGFESKYAKSTSKGFAFHNNKRKKTGIKSKLKKIVGWFSKK